MKLLRRINQLTEAELPSAPTERAHAIAEHLGTAGFAVCFVVHVDKQRERVRVLATNGDAQPASEAAASLAIRCSDAQKLEHVVGTTTAHGTGWCFGGAPLGPVAGGELVVIVADPHLSTRELQAIAAWAAMPAPQVGPVQSRDGLRPVIADLVSQFGADVIAIALFAQSGMHVRLHSRAGTVLHRWRTPIDTLWGDAAQHGAAYMLGDLSAHDGTEILDALGMKSCAIAGLDNGNGLATGALGIAAVQSLPLDVAEHLLDRASTLGREVIERFSRSDAPQRDAAGNIDLRAFARRVACRRFAVYTCTPSSIRMLSAHTADGGLLVSPPDPHEHQIIRQARDTGTVVSFQGAAAVPVGPGTVLYAHDFVRRSVERLYLALHDLQSDPRGRGDALPGADAA